MIFCFFLLFFFFNDTATTEIYTLSLHDALPIFVLVVSVALAGAGVRTDTAGPPSRASRQGDGGPHLRRADRKSTRLNSSHLVISYAVFCLKKKKKNTDRQVPAIQPRNKLSVPDP